MPRSGGRSKKQRTKIRLAAEAAPSDRPDANFLNDLAPGDDGPAASEPEAEEPNPSVDEAAPNEAEEEEPSNSSDDDAHFAVAAANARA